MYISNVHVYHASSYQNHIYVILGCNVALIADNVCFHISPHSPIRNPIYKHPSIFKFVLHIKRAAKRVYRNRGFCQLKAQFFSSLWPNLTIETRKKGKSHAQCVTLDIYVIKFHLIPIVLTLVLIIIINYSYNYLSCQIKYLQHWNKITFASKFFENSHTVFKLKIQINLTIFKLISQISLF